MTQPNKFAPVTPRTLKLNVATNTNAKSAGTAAHHKKRLHQQQHLLTLLQHERPLLTRIQHLTRQSYTYITMCNQFIVATSKIRPLPISGPTSTTPKTHHDSPENIVLRQVLADLKRHRLEGASQKVAETYNSLGLIRLHMQRDAQAARECHEEALRLFQELGDKKLMAITLHDLGYCFERMEEREMALKQYQQAIVLLKEEHFDKTHPRMIATQRAVNRVQRS